MAEVTLSDEAMKRLRRLSVVSNMAPVNVVRQAMGLAELLLPAIKNGARLFLHQHGKEIEVLWPK